MVTWQLELLDRRVAVTVGADVGAVVGLDVAGDVVGLDVVGAGVVADQQMVQPARVTELSLRHVKTEPAATATPLGPVRP